MSATQVYATQLNGATGIHLPGSRNPLTRKPSSRALPSTLEQPPLQARWIEIRINDSQQSYNSIN